MEVLYSMTEGNFPPDSKSSYELSSHDAAHAMILKQYGGAHEITITGKPELNDSVQTIVSKQ